MHPASTNHAPCKHHASTMHAAGKHHARTSTSNGTHEGGGAARAWLGHVALRPDARVRAPLLPPRPAPPPRRAPPRPARAARRRRRASRAAARACARGRAPRHAHLVREPLLLLAALLQLLRPPRPSSALPAAAPRPPALLPAWAPPGQRQAPAAWAAPSGRSRGRRGGRGRLLVVRAALAVKRKAWAKRSGRGSTSRRVRERGIGTQRGKAGLDGRLAKPEPVQLSIQWCSRRWSRIRGCARGCCAPRRP